LKDRLLPTPQGITLAGVILAKRNPNGTFAVGGREKHIHAMLQAAYGKKVPPQAIGYIRRGCEILAGVSDEELYNATHPFFPNPHAKVTSGNDFTPVTKGLMVFSLTGLDDMEDMEEGKTRLAKMQRSLRPDALLKSYGLPTWEELTKDDDADDDDDSDDDSGSADDDGGDYSASGNSHYNPDEPRIPAGQPGGGQWTTGDGTATDSDTNTITTIGDYEEMAYTTIKPMTHEDYVKLKQDFADNYLAATEKAAQELNVPVQNILGLAAYESTWGTSKIAQNTNNFFGLHYSDQFDEYEPCITDKGAEVSQFDDYAQSLQAFVDRKGDIVRNISDPVAFATALQNDGKFGINTDTGSNVMAYVSTLSSIIRSLPPVMARTRGSKNEICILHYIACIFSFANINCG
jgi:hypothetical protein